MLYEIFIWIIHSQLSHRNCVYLWSFYILLRKSIPCIDDTLTDIIMPDVRSWSQLIYVCFAWFDSLCPINNISVLKGQVSLGWTSTKLGLMFLLKDKTQWRSDAGEARTRGPSVASQALYHWATALPQLIYLERNFRLYFTHFYLCTKMPLRNSPDFLKFRSLGKTEANRLQCWHFILMEVTW